MAARKTPITTTDEQFPEPEVKESPRSKGNYHDGPAVDLKVDSTDRSYEEALTDEHREVLEKYGQLSA